MYFDTVTIWNVRQRHALIEGKTVCLGTWKSWEGGGGFPFFVFTHTEGPHDSLHRLRNVPDNADKTLSKQHLWKKKKKTSVHQLSELFRKSCEGSQSSGHGSQKRRSCRHLDFLRVSWICFASPPRSFFSLQVIVASWLGNDSLAHLWGVYPHPGF